MAERAHVSSVEALESFRASLIVYLARVRPLLDEVSTDLRRTQGWMETDQRLHWEREVRRCSRALEEAQQALLSARIATFQDATVLQQTAVHTARRALEDAHDKQRRLRQWTRDFGPRTESLARQVSALDSVLSHDLSRAVAWLTGAISHLAAYAEMRREPADPALPAFSEPDPAGTADPAAAKSPVPPPSPAPVEPLASVPSPNP